MTNYINSLTGAYLISEQQIRAANPNTSFGQPFVAPEPYKVVFPAPAPDYNPLTQYTVEDAPVLTVKGHWEQTWVVLPRFTEYTDDQDVVHTVAEQEAAAIAADAAAKTQAFVVLVTTTTQARLDDFAKTRNYDGILSACTYASSSVLKFKTEGQYCVDSRDATWATLYTIMGQVQAGQRPMPTPEEILSELPVLTWPNAS